MEERIASQADENILNAILSSLLQAGQCMLNEIHTITLEKFEDATICASHTCRRHWSPARLKKKRFSPFEANFSAPNASFQANFSKCDVLGLDSNAKKV